MKDLIKLNQDILNNNISTSSALLEISKYMDLLTECKKSLEYKLSNEALKHRHNTKVAHVSDHYRFWNNRSRIK